MGVKWQYDRQLDLYRQYQTSAMSFIVTPVKLWQTNSCQPQHQSKNYCMPRCQTRQVQYPEALPWPTMQVSGICCTDREGWGHHYKGLGAHILDMLQWPWNNHCKRTQGGGYFIKFSVPGFSTQKNLDPIRYKVLWKWRFKQWKRGSFGSKIQEKIYTKCLKSVK